jgi:quinol monooxygenase YgiN
VVRTLLYLRPRPGGRDEIVALYRRERILERALEQDGCLGAELYVPAGDDGDIVVTALWRDATAYEGWIANPARAANADELASVVDGDFDAAVRGEVYERALSAPPDGGDAS